jgi:hypothetical protein
MQVAVAEQTQALLELVVQVAEALEEVVDHH